MIGPTRTVLVVDDEPMVEEVIEAFAERQGCNHMSFNDPVEALQFFKGNHTSIDLAVIDLTLPGMNGLEFIDEMHRLSPELPAVLMTGQRPFPEEDITRHHIKEVLHKPITKQEFVEAISRIIGSCST